MPTKALRVSELAEQLHKEAMNIVNGVYGLGIHKDTFPRDQSEVQGTRQFPDARMFGALLQPNVSDSRACRLAQDLVD